MPEFSWLPISTLHFADSDKKIIGGMDIEELSSGTDPLQATIETEESSDKIKGQKSMMGYDGTNDSPNGSTPSKSKGKKSRDSATNSPASKSKSTPSRARKRVVDSDSDDDLFSSEFTRSTQPFTGASQIRRRNSRQMSSTYEFSDSEDSPTVPTPRRSSVKKPRSKAGSKSNSKDVTPSSSAKPRPKVVTQLDESDSDPVLSSPLKRRRSTAQVLTDESDVSPTKRRRGVVPNIEEEEEYSDDTIPLKVQSHSSRGEASSPITPSRVTRQKRASPRKHRTEKEKAKELMLRKRNGERIDAVTDSEPESEDERAVYDSDPELQVLKHFDDEEPDEESTTPKRKQRKNSKGRANASADENEYDSDFVVDDDDAPLGVPGLGLHDIPLQFRHASRKPLKEHFKDIVEWMIHNKLNPAFDRNDAIYEVAFDRLDKESSGYAISKFVSSQWTPDFVKAIKARPFYEERKLQPGEALLTQGEEKCEPCHHRKHPPTWGIKLRGKAYDKDSLEEIEQDYDDSENEESSSSSSSDSDEDVSEKSNTSSAGKRSRNGEGALIVREEREWLSGVYVYMRSFIFD